MAGNIGVGAEACRMAMMLMLLLRPVLVFARAVVDVARPAVEEREPRRRS